MILDNPFHVLGLVANADARQRTRREAQIKRYLEVKKPLVFQHDLYFQGCRRNERTVAHALDRLHDARDRIGPGLFWFTKDGVLDDHALHLLLRGDIRGALEVLQRVEHLKPTRQYASSLNNLGTIRLLLSLSGKSPGQIWPDTATKRQDYLLRGLRVKAQLVGGLSGQELSSFCATFSDDVATNDPQYIGKVFSESLELFKGEAEMYGLDLPTSELGALLDVGGPRTTILKNDFALSIRGELERSIRECKAAWSEDASNAALAGKKLMFAAREELPKLAALLADTSFEYRSMADGVAEALLDASVAYFQFHVRTETVTLEIATETESLARYATDISFGVSVQERGRESLEALEGIMSHMRDSYEMDLLLRPLRAWIEKAERIRENPSGLDHEVRFLRGAVVEDTPTSPSVIGMLEAVRRHGIKVHGGEFAISGEMIDYASHTCSTIVTTAVQICNLGISMESRRAIAELLIWMERLFRPVAETSGRLAHVFAIRGDVFEYLHTNRMIASENVAPMAEERRADRVPPSTENAGCLGCASVMVLFAVLALVLAAF